MTNIEILKEITAIIEAYNDLPNYTDKSIIHDLHILRKRIYEKIK